MNVFNQEMKGISQKLFHYFIHGYECTQTNVNNHVMDTFRSIKKQHSVFSII